MMSPRLVNGCLHRWQCVAVALSHALCFLYCVELYRVRPALRPLCLMRSRSSASSLCVLQ